MKIQFKFQNLKSWFSLKFIHLIITFLMIIILGVTGIFLYKNFYQTLTQAQEIIILKGEVAPEMLDFEKFNQVLNKIEEKTKPEEINWSEVKNPFTSSQEIPKTPETTP